jgi:hypothetical protein
MAAPQTLQKQLKYFKECTFDKRETELQRKIAKLKFSEKYDKFPPWLEGIPGA